MTTTSAELLLDTARRGDLHHAVILHGPSADALVALATRVAKTLNCINGSTGDDCASCQRIDRRLHPDVHFIEVGNERKMISVEQIRDIVSAASMRPYEGRTKVFVVAPADALSVSGSNALLKTLEEPSRDTVFLLITRSPDLLLPTIRSRSQAIYIGERPMRAIGASAPEARREQIPAEGNARDAAAETMGRLLGRYAAESDATALLALAAMVAGDEAPKDAMALLAVVLTDEEGEAAALPRAARLAAADELLAGIRALGVNADARLIVEAALAELTM